MAQINKQIITPKQASRKRTELDRLLDVELFKALSDPTRVLLLSCLMKCNRSCSVSEVAQCCAVDFSVVARHLSLLARSGILQARKEGRTVWYRVCSTELVEKLRSLATAIEDCGGCCREERCSCCE